jgi:hypothetical protein
VILLERIKREVRPTPQELENDASWSDEIVFIGPIELSNDALSFLL